MYVSRLHPGEIEKYIDLEQKFRMAKDHIGAMLHKELRGSLDMQHHAIRDHRAVIDAAADRLAHLRQLAPEPECQQAAVRGLALGSLILSMHLNTVRWPETLEESLKAGTSDKDISRLYDETIDYMDGRPVLRNFVKTYVGKACESRDWVEPHGIAWGGMGLVLMAEDEGRFQDYVDQEGVDDVIRSFEELTYLESTHDME